MFGTKFSLMVDPRKTAVFHSFHTYLRLPNLITPGETPRPLVSYALFQCSSQVVENLGKNFSVSHFLVFFLQQLQDERRFS